MYKLFRAVAQETSKRERRGFGNTADRKPTE